MSERTSLHSGEVRAGEIFLARAKSFTRRSHRPPANLQHTWDEHASHYVTEIEHGLGYTTITNPVHFDPERLFGRRSPLTIEVGSGTGEQIVEVARIHPDRNYLAFEVWVPGIAKLISKVVGTGVENIRVIEANAQLALSIVFDEVIAREVWTSFPDPWRKARHHECRLVSADFAPEVMCVLENGGPWHLAVDWDDHVWQMRDMTEGYELLENPYEGERSDLNDPEFLRGGLAPRSSGRIETHLKTRRTDTGRKAHDLITVRLPHEDASSEDE